MYSMEFASFILYADCTKIEKHAFLSKKSVYKINTFEHTPKTMPQTRTKFQRNVVLKKMNKKKKKHM
jgi:hypothetical protein